MPNIPQALSVVAIGDAIRALNQPNTLLLLRQFFEGVFTSLQDHIESSSRRNDSNLIELRLQMTNNIIQAAHSALATGGDDDTAASSCDSTLMIESMILMLLIPMMGHLETIKQQRLSSVSGARLPDPQALLRCEKTVSAIMTAMFMAQEKEDPPSYLRYKDLICLMLQIYDEYLLPLHLSPTCQADMYPLLSGLLPLLQHLRRLQSDRLLQQATQEFVTNLYASDMLKQTLACLATSTSMIDAATCRALLVTLVEFSGIFIYEDQDQVSARQGDILPASEALSELNVEDMVANMQMQKGRTVEAKESGLEKRRWAIALYFLEIRANKKTSAPSGLAEAVMDMIWNDKKHEYLYGSSWVQLTWMYMKFDNELDSEGGHKPFTFSRIISGLKTSISGSSGWFCKRMLGNCLEDMLPWIWKHDARHAGSELRIFNEVILELILIWLLNLFPFETSDLSRLIVSNSMEHAVIRCMGSLLIERQRVVNNTLKSFFESVASVTWRQLANPCLMHDAYGYMWHMFGTVSRLIDLSEKTGSLSGWEITQTDTAAVADQILQQIEIIHNDLIEDEDEHCFYGRFASNVRLLLESMECGEESIFDSEPQLLTSLWNIVEDLMDNMKGSNGAKNVCVVLSLHLLSKAHTLLPDVFMITSDDLTMMVFYVFELQKQNPSFQHYQCSIRLGRYSLLLLIQELLELVTDRLQGMHGLGELPGCGIEVSNSMKELSKYLDLLMDATENVLIKTTQNATVWAALSRVNALLRRQQFMRQLVLHLGHVVLLRHLLKRWLSESMLTAQRWEQTRAFPAGQCETHCGHDDEDDDGEGIKRTDLEDMKSLSMERLSRSAADILAIMKLCRYIIA
ncbi:hypothetical protein EDD11_010312 [Mortierella claussenii]|nr:hypothetical protein EDD11_010312 [Mortierella claussenii]